MYPNLIETLLNVPLYDQQHFRLSKVHEIKDYFVAEIKETELMNKRVSKYIASFDYFDNVLSVTTGNMEAPVGITGASFCIAFSICTGKSIIKLLC